MSKRQKHGGRKAGTPNRKSLEALEIFGELEFCPLEEVIQRLKKPGISDELYASTCVKLLEFKFPKRKAIEHTVDFSALSNEEILKEAKTLVEGIELELKEEENHGS